MAFLQSTVAIEANEHLIDSELFHNSAWEYARQELSSCDMAKYFQIPHGRVAWDTMKHVGILYHGNSTPVPIFNELARIFRLPRWEARLNEDYLTGEALYDFYRLD